MTDQFYLAATTFIFTVTCTAMATTWAVSRMLASRDATMIAMMNAHELSDAERFAAVRSEIDTMGDSVRREFGETGSALRQKMHEMEMWGRDHNLSKRSFDIVTGEIKKAIETMAGKIDNVIMRNAGIDKGNQRL